MKKRLSERGSASIEFIAMVPLLLMLLVVIWQFFVAGFAVYNTQAAANDAAKVYAATNDVGLAQQEAQRMLDTNKHVSGSVGISGGGSGGEFTATVQADFQVSLLPRQVLGYSTSIPIERTVTGRVMQ
ncbi:pilus assembly protein [Paenalkalicoccus suaedae]|uniref:Pilus assembly protein n=1 Tax=Paenalkalicoccus suaedae TaxID=2592382 RepID=A0A859FH67_9BACI|nr:TadE/TadG family type IV pilus assembly protein [Paenalkalicoccus suaedae]QKS72477.1 pilus assembly protein [Paenalkalicoccus suaedae]